MKNEEISMPELIQILEKSFSSLQKQLDEFKTDVDQHFSWLEANMATKSEINRLVDVLRGRQIISEFDANYVIA